MDINSLLAWDELSNHLIGQWAYEVLMSIFLNNNLSTEANQTDIYCGLS